MEVAQVRRRCQCVEFSLSPLQNRKEPVTRPSVQSWDLITSSSHLRTSYWCSWTEAASLVQTQTNCIDIHSVYKAVQRKKDEDHKEFNPQVKHTCKKDEENHHHKRLQHVKTDIWGKEAEKILKKTQRKQRNKSEETKWVWEGTQQRIKSRRERTHWTTVSPSLSLRNWMSSTREIISRFVFKRLSFCEMGNEGHRSITGKVFLWRTRLSG